MRTFSKLAALVLTLVLAHPAFAGAKPAVQLTTSLVYPVSMSDGRGLPPSIGHGVGFVLPIHGKWTFYLEPAMTTGLSEFKPAPRILIGPTVKLADRFLLSATLLYKYIPKFSGDEQDAHLIGPSLAPIFPLGNGVSLAIPLGPSYNTSTKSWSLAFTASISVKLAR